MAKKPIEKAVYQAPHEMSGGSSQGGGQSGYVPAPPSSGYNTKYLRADGTWTVPPDTTYESKPAASGGTDLSLVTTGEKYQWNNASDFSGDYNDLINKPTLGTASSKDVSSSGDASSSQVVMGNDSRLTDARPASDVSSWAKQSTKPTYTKSEVGLGNVGNFKAVSTVANQGLTDTEKRNARINIGANVIEIEGVLYERFDYVQNGIPYTRLKEIS